MAKSNLSRRDFLKLSATAAAVGLVAPSALGDQKAEEAPKLDYRVLGRTGLKVTTVSLGCMVAPRPVVAKALDLGVNWFDTANRYKVEGEPSEVAVGEILKGKRNQVSICTKIPPGSPADMEANLATSLQRLQTDHVELLLAHGVKSKENVMRPETLAFLEKAKKDGKARFIGVSTHENMGDVIYAAIEAKIYDAVLTTFNFNVDEDTLEAVAAARKANVGIIAMKTQAALIKALNASKKSGEPAKIPFKESEALSLHQAALKWALDNEAVACAVPGTRDLQQLASNLAVMGKRLAYLDRRRLERVAPLAAATYCSGCDACAGTCRFGVDIPAIRRSEMYLSGYGEPQLARETYQALQANAARCAECASCTATCVRGVALQPILREAHSRLA